MDPDPLTPAERWQEQAAAWNAEKARRAALPWWRKAIEAYWDWHEAHALPLKAAVVVTALTVLISGVALVAAWLVQALR